MSPPRVVALLLGSLCACAHATRVERPTPEKQEAKPRGRAGPKPVERGHPPLAESPEDLLVAGGVEQVQKALAARGYLDLSTARPGRIDAKTTAALRKFQSDQGLARTGVPDHDTVRRLGLDPDKLFRRAGAT
jgi:peptidoglycan hydrolase-like protein with peptidoglycan-binding domain